MLSTTWLCENSFHPEEVWIVEPASMQYLSGLLSWSKRKTFLKKGSTYTCWVRSHLSWNAGEKHGVETSSEQTGLKFYLHSLCKLKAREGRYKESARCISNNLCLCYLSMGFWELRLCLSWNRDISVGVWQFQEYESWAFKRTVLALQLCGSCRGIVISDYCTKPDVKKQDVRLVWKMTEKDSNKYFKLSVCVLEEMKFWEQTKSLGYS